jgi:hypothetical protein
MKKYLMFPNVMNRCTHKNNEFINIAGEGSNSLKYCNNCGALKWSFISRWELPKIMETYLK